MFRFLICSRVAHKTGRKLASAITDRQGTPCYYYNYNTPPHPDQLHVRWGSHRATSNNCLNRQDAVVLASNKLAALSVMSEAAVPTPRLFGIDAFYERLEVRRIFRKRNRHAGNDDPYIVEAGEPADRARAAPYDYALEYIATASEYRVHVFDKAVLRVQEKRPNGDGEPDPDIRSASRGWGLRARNDLFDDADLTRPAIRAVEALGLHFGAVDILRGIDGNHYVIEVNTAPGLNNNGIALYADALVGWGNARMA